jgi:hypothetical protein
MAITVILVVVVVEELCRGLVALVVSIMGLVQLRVRAVVQVAVGVHLAMDQYKLLMVLLEVVRAIPAVRLLFQTTLLVRRAVEDGVRWGVVVSVSQLLI